MTTSRDRASIRTELPLPLRFADGWSTPARGVTFGGLAEGREHVALRLGPAARRTPLVRVHSECLTGDVLGSARCDCGPQLREAVGPGRAAPRCDCGPQLRESVERVADAGGYLLYLRQEGRGIGLYAKLDAYALQDAGLDTYEANLALGHGEDERDYTAAAQMLLALGTDRIRLLSNNPDKATQLEACGIEVAQRIPTGVHMSAANARYLTAKRDHTAHTLELPAA